MSYPRSKNHKIEKIFSFNMQVLQSPAQPTSYRVMNNQMHKKITLEGYVNASAALKK